MTGTRILARSAALLVVCIVAACQSSSPLDLGPTITDETAWPGSVLTWSRSDSEIVFSVAPWKARALKAFRVPDGSQLLCQTGKYEYRVEPAVVDLASGTTAALPERFGNLIGVDPAVFGVDLIWKSSGLRAVYRSDTSGEVVVENAATGERTVLRADSVPGGVVNQPIWSPDG